MKTDVFDRWIRRKTCESCAILTPRVMCFVMTWSLQEDMDASEIAAHYFVHHIADESGSVPRDDFGVEFKGDTRRRLASRSDPDEVLMVAQGGNVLLHTPSGGKSENKIDQASLSVARSPRFIDDRFYAAGMDRGVLRRDGVGNWTNISDSLREVPTTGIEALGMGFEDVDGFAKDNIYAAGGDGEVFRYDGEQWSPIDVPSNAELTCICCASDGYVYIGGGRGLIMRGRDEEWKIISAEDSNREWQQIVDYNGQILAVDEWGAAIYAIGEKGVTELEGTRHLAPSTPCRCLAVGHGMLLAAGHECASLYDGTSWRSLFKSAEAEDLALASHWMQQIQEALDEANEKLDELDDAD
ncbi:MAG: hypothetical protein AAFV43_14850 [Planctomycetota bacterium]